MANTRLRTWLKATIREQWQPLLLLVVPVAAVVWATRFEFALPLLILPCAAFAVGFVLRPRHVWVVWLGAVVIQWIAMGVLGKYAHPEGETVPSLIVGAFPWMAMGVLIPIWPGRTARNIRDRDKPSEAADPSRR